MRPTTRPAALLALTLGAPAFVLAEAPDPQSVERGRYLSAIAGCNDCHTPGYLLADGAVDEALWLTGDRFGWRGPWGTTYPPNLRLYIAPLTEDQWVTKARTLRARPPMPWYTLNQMAESDLRDLYRFIHHLGPAGEPAPAYVPPGEEPGTPFALFPAMTQAEPGGAVN
jgi:mono/diheme cytochrome c family protein